MITTLLIPTLLLTTGGDHAAHHPSTTNLYFEVPSVSEARNAYADAPMIRLFEDPELQEFLATVTGAEPKEINLGNLAERLVEEVRERLPVAGVGVLDLVTKVDHASFSISGLDLYELVPLIQTAEQGDPSAMLERLALVKATLVVDFLESSKAESAQRLIQSHLLELALASAPRAPVLIDASREPGTPLDLSEYELGPSDFPVFVSVSQAETRLTIHLGMNPELPSLARASDTLAANQRFQNAGKHWVGTGGTTILNTYFSISGVDELLGLFEFVPECPPQLVEAAEFLLDTSIPDGECHTRMRTRLEGGSFHSETFLLQAKPDPANQLFSAEPITRESFRMAPADAAAVSAFHLNKEFLAKTLMKGLTTMSGQDEPRLLADLREQYDFHPATDLVGSIGGSAVTYTLPYTSIGQPQVFLALDLVDSAAFANGLEALAQYAEDKGEGMIAVHSKPYRKQPLVVFSPGKALLKKLFDNLGEAAPGFIQMNLVIAVTQDRAIISSSSIYTKRELKRLLKSDLSERHPLMDAAKDFPAGIQAYSTTDWGSMIAGGYDSVRGFLPLFLGGAGVELPFALEDLPSGDLFPKYFQPSVVWSRQTEEGVYSHGVSSFGPEVPFLLGACVGAGFVIASSEMEPPRAWSAEQEHEGNGTEHADHQRLNAAILLYQAEIGSFPKALKELTVPTENFPDGFMGGQPLPKNVTYKLNAGGDGYELETTGTGVSHEHHPQGTGSSPEDSEDR